MASFNVLTQPWIPVVDLEGCPHEFGLLGALEQAHKLSVIVDPSPAIEYGIYRLLVAFVMDAFEINELEDIEDLLAEEKFDMERVKAYTDKCGDCFDLFHPEKPFLQMDAADTKVKLVADLLQQIPSGSSLTHFHHFRAESHCLAPEVCARALCAFAPFITSGGQGHSPSINGKPPWYVLIRGGNLFGTILLNSCAMPMPWSISELNVPAWRDISPFAPKREVRRFSLLSGLTWRPRTVRLIPEGSGRCTYADRNSEHLVREMYFGPGLKTVNDSDTWTDPSVSYRSSSKGRSPLRPQENRELWRDTGPLALLQQQEFNGYTYVRPLIVSQYKELQNRCAVPEGHPLEIDCYGLRTDGNAKIFEWQHERLSLKAQVLMCPRSGEQTLQATELAERTASILRGAVSEAYSRKKERKNSLASSGKRKKKELVFANRLKNAILTSYWSSLRPHFEQEYLEELARQDVNDPEAPGILRKSWIETLKQEATKALETVLEQLDTDAQAIRRQVAARDEFWKRFSKLKKEATGQGDA